MRISCCIILFLYFVIQGICMENKVEDCQNKIVEKSFVLEEIPYRLNLWNHAGQIKISGWDKRVVLVKATINWHEKKGGGEPIDIKFYKESNSIDIVPVLPVKKYKKFYFPNLPEGAICEDILWKYGKIIVTGNKDVDAFNSFIDYEIYLPKEVNFKITNIAGDIELKSTIGKAEFNTCYSNLKCSEHSGELIIDSGTGNIKIEGVNSIVEVDTGSGNVALSGVKSSKIGVDTGSGKVRIGKIDSSEININTGSGSVDFDYEEIKADKIRIDTGSGDIYFRIPPSRSAIVNLSTVSGKVDIHRVKSQLLAITSNIVKVKIGDSEEDSSHILLDQEVEIFLFMKTRLRS